MKPGCVGGDWGRVGSAGAEAHPWGWSKEVGSQVAEGGPVRPLLGQRWGRGRKPGDNKGWPRLGAEEEAQSRGRFWGDAHGVCRQSEVGDGVGERRAATETLGLGPGRGMSGAGLPGMRLHGQGRWEIGRIQGGRTVLGASWGSPGLVPGRVASRTEGDRASVPKVPPLSVITLSNLSRGGSSHNSGSND